MKTSVLSLAVVALAGAALGDVYFTNSTPGADFNDPANWQNAGDSLEGENLRIPNGFSPRMTADLTAFSIDNWNWDVSTPFDLDLDGHTLRFTSYAHWQNSMTNIFRNGTLRFVDGAGSRFWYENTWTPGQVVFDNMTVEGNVWARTSDASIVVTNGTKFTGSLELQNRCNSFVDVSGAGTVVDLDGGELVCGGHWESSAVTQDGDIFSNLCYRVRGGAVVTNFNVIRIGQYAQDSLFEVDNATMRQNSVNWSTLGGTQYASNNTMRVTNNAYVNIKNIRIGSDGGCGNTLEVCNGGVLEVRGNDEPGDSEWDCAFRLGEGGENDNPYPAVGNRLWIHDGGVVTNRYTGFYHFMIGRGNSFSNRVDVTDGGEFYLASPLWIGPQWADNGLQKYAILNVERGGRLLVGGGAQPISFGQYYSPAGLPTEHLVNVADGGVVEAKQFLGYGIGNVVCVSNGTIRVGEDFYTATWNNPNNGSNNVVVVKGSHSRIEAGWRVNITCGARVRFEIPAEGYDAAPIFGTSGVRFSNDGDPATLPGAIEVDCAAFQRAGGGSVTLFESVDGYLECSTGWVTDDGPEMAALRANLPPGCELHAVDFKRIVLTAPSTAGTVILFR